MPRMRPTTIRMSERTRELIAREAELDGAPSLNHWIMEAAVARAVYRMVMREEQALEDVARVTEIVKEICRDDP